MGFEAENPQDPRRPHHVHLPPQVQHRAHAQRHGCLGLLRAATRAKRATHERATHERSECGATWKCFAPAKLPFTSPPSSHHPPTTHLHPSPPITTHPHPSTPI